MGMEFSVLFASIVWTEKVRKFLRTPSTEERLGQINFESTEPRRINPEKAWCGNGSGTGYSKIATTGTDIRSVPALRAMIWSHIWRSQIE